MFRTRKNLVQSSQSANPSASRQRQSIERLEERQMMTANMYIDFGEAFLYDAGLDAQVLQVSESRLDDSDLNGPSDKIPSTLKSLLDAMDARSLDYNADGVVNSSDVESLGNDVINLVKRYFEPFDVNVFRAASSSLDDIADYLDGGSDNDAYVVMAGAQGPAGGLGWSKVDTNYNDDNVAFGFAEDLLDTVDSDPAKAAFSLARTAAHEAAHSFGLEHLEKSGLSDDALRLQAGDIMNVSNQDLDDDDVTDRFGEMNLAYRWTFTDDDGDQQNAFDDLETALGLRPYSAGYITGTGAHDKITLTGGSNGMVSVTVEAYSDDDYGNGDLIASQSYQVDATYGIIVEGSLGNDRIDATGVSARVTLRGGDGNDILIGGSGADTLMGDSGNDTVAGQAGSDTYLFKGPRWMDYDSDVLTEISGSNDKLDFRALPFAVNVDLATTTEQATHHIHSGAMIINGQIYDSFYFVIGQSTESLLNLRLGTGPFSNSTGFETVYGTSYNDVLRGNELDNYLYGFHGIDRLEGRAGNDYLNGGYDSDEYEFKGLNLGTDDIVEYSYTGANDVLDFSQFGGSVQVDLTSTANQAVNYGDLVIDLTSAWGINHVIGSQYSDEITGNSYANWIYGLGGNDTLRGGYGNDFLKGGVGHDDLFGDDGIDTLWGESDNDYLHGGYDGDKDVLWGGSGSDTFVRDFYYGLVKSPYGYSYYGWIEDARESNRKDFNAKDDVFANYYH